MRLNVTAAERDDIYLALRMWIMELDEPLPKPRSALARRRRAKVRQLEALADRIMLAELEPMPETDA